MSRQGDRVRDRLAGRTILLSGASGFLGKAVLAALLRNGYRPRGILVMLRARSEEEAEERLRDEVLGADAFAGLDGAALRAQIGDGGLRAVAGDLTREEVAPRGSLAGVDVVVHCAATVSFEEPLDGALELNSLGPSRLRDALARDGSRPHFVHVSTAYVADRRNGESIAEDGLPHHSLPGLDPAGLLAAARGWREDAEREAGAERRARELARAAQRDAARRPGLDPRERAEELRRRWVERRLSARGRRQAQALGWPDTYALSKALGERLLLEGPGPTTVVRPTIIESALAQPYPGWLEGIKVADPLILAYAARGLTHLPGRRPNRIDIVTVDQVANACVAAAAHPPEGGHRTIAVASTARNPLAIGELADQIKAYFTRHPLRRPGGAPIEIGELRFVPRRAALRPALRRQRIAAGLARLAISSPVRVPAERALRANRSLSERITRMVEIYGAYTELDCVFDDSNAQALLARLTPEDREELPFDTAAIDWDEYLQEVHLPAVHRLSGANQGEAAAG